MSSGVIAPALPPTLPLDFALDDAHIAHQPAEQRCGSRADVRLMVSPGPDQPVHAAFADLAELLAPGDLVVVNNSSTVPAAADAVLDDDRRIVLHASTELPGGLWMVEPRQPVAGGATETLRLDGGPVTAHLVDGTLVELLRPAPGSRRLWLAVMGGDADLVAALGRTGRPIRYGYIPHDYPLESYQTVFAVEPGAPEMPSAARPFTPEIVTSLVRRGVGVAAITLHTGVSSLEGHELPYPERYHVPASTAAVVNTTRRSGGHVIAVGTRWCGRWSRRWTARARCILLRDGQTWSSPRHVACERSTVC